jgi:MFS transporter, FHS family, L-fucose permease
MEQTRSQKNKYLLPFILVTSLFFIWAFLHNINPILIPHLKKASQLTDAESALIDTAVYFGYFLVALPAGWYMHKHGYKNGIIFGLILFAIGAALFIPAASTRSYTFFLVALFIMASGATFLETVANPYVAKLGDKDKSEQRLNFAQSFNGVGAFVAPIIGGEFILSGIEHSEQALARMSPQELNTYLQSEADTVKIPYMVICAVLILLIILFKITRLPEIHEEGENEDSRFSLKVLRNPQVRGAVIAQFFYVGAQVAVGSFFIRYARGVMNMPEVDAAYWWSFAMIGFMVGRFTGTFLMRYIKPSRLLALYSLINVLLLAVGVLADGVVAVYAVAAVPFFMSIMFPTIFAMGIKGLGEETKIAASLIVMSIIGGAFAPLLMGYVSDVTGSMQIAYVVPLLCFLPVMWFAMSKTAKNSDAEVKMTAAH